ncbi:MAG: chemotaxis-specific protein-glutamate methyltransferase CheB [Chloroflexota bacterium]
MGDEIRIVLAEDSPTVRRYLAMLIENTPDMRVVGEASNGAEAVQMVATLKPDVVSMDVNMPKVDGLEATRQIMAETPTPIVVVSGLLDIDVQLSLQAIEAGALAVVGKPPHQHHVNFATAQHELLTTLRAMAGVKVISRRQYRVQEVSSAIQSTPKVTDTQTALIAIGASTGGPSALMTLLRDLPATLAVPIVVVQHMPQEFIAGLVVWLDSITALDVRLAKHDMRLEAGTVTIALADTHLQITCQGELLKAQLTEAGNLPSRYVPSVDVLFQSVADTLGKKSMGIILTGMGDDGARGLSAIRQVGGKTIAQDERSSTVFGMPKAAIAREAVQVIVPVSRLATQITKML